MDTITTAKKLKKASVTAIVAASAVAYANTELRPGSKKIYRLTTRHVIQHTKHDRKNDFGRKRPP
ncbi:MAG TPA: hypothetical protein VII56_00550 [Rhizomicrobium sp.]